MTREQLQPFCDPTQTRWKIDEPFVSGGWMYATNGYICLRVKTSEADSLNLQYPPVADCFKWSVGENWQPWPTDPGGVFEGDGPCEVPTCESGMDIGDIDAEPKKCERCNGQGHYVQPLYRFIGGVRVAIKYDRLIAALPNVRWHIPSGIPNRVIFTFDDNGQPGYGVVATRKADDSEL